MTNFEKYKDTLVDILKDGTTFAVDEDDKPVPCSTSGIPCRECRFNSSGIYDCSKQRKEWLEATVWDGEIPADVITIVIPEDLKNAIRAFYKARQLVCSDTDCTNCALKYDSWCYEISQFETLFYIFGPELTKDVKASLLKWYEIVKKTHPEYLR